MTQVLKDGAWVEVNASELKVGDTVWSSVPGFVYIIDSIRDDDGVPDLKMHVVPLVCNGVSPAEKCATCGRPLPVEDLNDVFTLDDEWKADLKALVPASTFDVVCPEIEARIAKAARTGR